VYFTFDEYVYSHRIQTSYQKQTQFKDTHAHTKENEHAQVS